ncbi:MAG TPA: nitrate/sulfonate/bicarbonate ABC transporter ATP-binding protein, partial [Microbacterium sp.]|nr:nitrate/sulfonate/bicarbonate ABC transporter ATP-binding protein [Microbacterium sp.]
MTEPTASGSVLTTGSATTGAQGESLGTGLQISGLNKVFTTGRRTVTARQDANLHTEQGTFLS